MAVSPRLPPAPSRRACRAAIRLPRSYQQRQSLAADALRYIGAPEAERARVADYYDYLARFGHPGPDAGGYLAELPRGLQEDLKRWVWRGPVIDLPSFP